MSAPTQLLGQLTGVGADPVRGGCSRHVFDRAETELRTWFVEQAERRHLRVETDRNANLWAWWGEPGPHAVVTGSHLDSVPGGGAFDGPLGVVSALSAVDAWRARGHAPRRPFAIAVFAEEEGGRFGVPCLGSRLLTGAIDPDRARALRDPDGVTFAEAMGAAGLRPELAGRDGTTLGRIGQFVELHVEQGRALEQPVGVASSVLAHGRWRFRFHGQGNHAGTTAIDDRRDPMLPAAEFVLAARRAAEAEPGARATVGKLTPTPASTNAIPSRVDLWLDARSPQRLRPMVDDLAATAEELAAQHGCSVDVRQDSASGHVRFDPQLRDQLATALHAPLLETGAGHDAGQLADHVASGMLFVRNPTGVSHAPDEHAEPDDCAAGATALADVLTRLTR